MKPILFTKKAKEMYEKMIAQKEKFSKELLSRKQSLKSNFQEIKK